ncbi:MAG TPA: alpha/beta fold hydrolase [Solirubrobacteraceae bacterium]|nr:alpha/beta fold hydrolase [Solirubrobacteraceae bacterium]
MVEVDGRSLHVERRGSGEPLVLLQGLSGHSGHWGEAFLEALARDFDVIAYDHRGTGHSSRVEGSFTLAELADDAAGLVRALGLEDAHVLGISMGGMVAQELALAHPELVRTLTLGCTMFGGPRALFTAPAVLEEISEAVMSGDRERALRNGFEVNLSEGYRAGEGRWEEWQASSAQNPVGLSVTLLQLEAIDNFHTADRLGSLEVPTLVLHGTEDRLLDVRNGEMLADVVPGARLEVFEGAGHLFFWEQPERAAALVREHALGDGTPGEMGPGERAAGGRPPARDGDAQ